MRLHLAAVLAVGACLLAACGDDGGGEGGGDGDPALVALLQEQAGQTEAIATCIADRVGDDPDVDRGELEAIIRGEGTDDVATSNAYGDAALACAQEQLGDLSDLPFVPDDISDQLDLSS
jgi:hypothetical protein